MKSIESLSQGGGDNKHKTKGCCNRNVFCRNSRQLKKRQRNWRFLNLLGECKIGMDFLRNVRAIIRTLSLLSFGDDDINLILILVVLYR